ncbi:MAG: helix-hairpin-helix domain-containing protein [Acidobacteria bacterium]|nr:helix-hairpin-helix domain-containing protein [Acidobacteriota bacterium]
MKTNTSIGMAFTGTLVTLATSVALTAGSAAPPQFSGEGLPDGPGKDVTVRMCGLCHEPRRAASVRLTVDGWAAVIDSMIKRGAKGSEEDVKVVLDYLSTHFLGEAAQPVNVNTAPQIDLELVAGLLRSEARAVVEYREKNGPFKTLDDMKKVPGLDFKKIDSKRDFVVAM